MRQRLFTLTDLTQCNGKEFAMKKDLLALIELLVVVAIIETLVSMLRPALSKARATVASKRTSAMAFT